MNDSNELRNTQNTGAAQEVVLQVLVGICPLPSQEDVRIIRPPSFRLCVRNTEDWRAEPPLDDRGSWEAQVRRQSQNEVQVSPCS